MRRTIKPQSQPPQIKRHADPGCFHDNSLQQREGRENPFSRGEANQSVTCFPLRSQSPSGSSRGHSSLHSIQRLAGYCSALPDPIFITTLRNKTVQVLHIIIVIMPYYVTVTTTQPFPQAVRVTTSLGLPRSEVPLAVFRRRTRG